MTGRITPELVMFEMLTATTPQLDPDAARAAIASVPPDVLVTAIRHQATGVALARALKARVG